MSKHQSPPTPAHSPYHQLIEITCAPNVTKALTEYSGHVASALGTTIEMSQQAMAASGAKLLRATLPDSTLLALESLGYPSPTSVVVLRKLAALDAPETPVNGFIDDGLMARHDILLAGAMQIAGTTPCAFAFENNGRIGRNVVANPNQKGKASSHGSDAELFYHQDNCGQPFEGEVLPNCPLPPMPRQLGFFAVRNNERVPTRLLLVDDALRYLSKPIIDILSRPHFRIGAPDSVSADGFGAEHIDCAPIVRMEDGFLSMRYDPFLVTTKDKAAMLANARLMVALEEAAPNTIDVVLEPGDIMIFKNYRLMHMRVAFEPSDAPTSRWLRRFYGRG